MIDWYAKWCEFMQPHIQARIRRGYKSKYMRLAIFLRICKEHMAQ